MSRGRSAPALLPPRLLALGSAQHGSLELHRGCRMSKMAVAGHDRQLKKVLPYITHQRRFLMQRANVF